MNLELNEKIAMVAAASKGLGKATATSLMKEGCRVSVCGRHQETLDRVRRELADLGGEENVLTTVCDVSKARDIERWFGATTERFGSADILVTNTGGPPTGRFLQLTDETWKDGVELTLMNVVRMSRLAIEPMLEKQWGRIVHITSLVAKQPMDILTISSTLRAGLSALTKTMSNELAQHNILVNAVLPGHILTERQAHLNTIRSSEEGMPIEEIESRAQRTIPIRRYGRPEEIGDVIAFLCSERASYITGATIQIDGGIIHSTF